MKKCRKLVIRIYKFWHFFCNSVVLICYNCGKRLKVTKGMDQVPNKELFSGRNMDKIAHKKKHGKSSILVFINFLLVLTNFPFCVYYAITS